MAHKSQTARMSSYKLLEKFNRGQQRDISHTLHKTPCWWCHTL